MCLIIFQRYDPAVGEWMGLKRPVERVRRKGDGLRWPGRGSAVVSAVGHGGIPGLRLEADPREWLPGLGSLGVRRLGCQGSEIETVCPALALGFHAKLWRDSVARFMA